MIEGKLDSRGFLYIKRGSEWKKMLCKQGTQYFCSDSCALFGEPIVAPFVGASIKESNKRRFIRLCYDKQWHFDKFTDERK